MPYCSLAETNFPPISLKNPRLIETLQPNAVMVETDESRLERIGIPTLEDIKVTRVVTSEDIELPLSPLLSSKPETPWFLNPLGMAKDVFLQAFTKVARALLTNMYNDMGDRMNAKGGGEFLRAIQCAENCTACDTVILGDRNSLVTISRAAELALESGDAMGVLGRLQQVNGDEMEKLETKIKAELKEAHGDDLDESQVTVAITASRRVVGENLVAGWGDNLCLIVESTYVKF